MKKARQNKAAFSVVSARLDDAGAPSNIAVERQVLGALLMDAENILPEVLPILSGIEPFWIQEHEAVYQAIRTIHETRGPIDPFSVMEELSRAGELDRVGGIEALTGLVKEVGSLENAKYHATILRSKGLKRRMLLDIQEITAEIHAENMTADGLRVEILARLAKIPAESIGDAASYPNLGDVKRKLGDIKWLWDGWIAGGVMTILTAPGGVGKTRTVLDLCRRLWFGLAMPDDTPNPLPAGTKTLWLFVDRNWQGAARVAESFGIPLEAICTPGTKENPVYIPELDDPETLIALEQQIMAQRPALLVIDTITFATSYKTGQADEAKMAYDPLMDMAARTGVAVLALTHTNKDGETLGRRINERARVNIHLTRPDREKPDRLRFWVDKTDDYRPAPPALGVTFHTDRNEYDNNPPAEAESEHKKTGPTPIKSTHDAEWLVAKLEDAGQPMMVARLIDDARDEGILKAKSPSPLYAAKRRAPSIRPGWSVSEIEVESRNGKMLKYWKLEPDNPETEGNQGPQDETPGAKADPFAMEATNGHRKRLIVSSKVNP